MAKNISPDATLVENSCSEPVSFQDSSLNQTLTTKNVIWSVVEICLIHSNTIVAGAIIIITCCLILYFLFRPLNLFRDYTEYGYEQVCQGYKNNAIKRDLINKCRRRKKMGEQPPSYPNGWFAIIESDQLPVRTAKEIDVLGQNLVAWRGESEKCYVADAYCPHLGAHLAVGGTVHEECIECPFHSWSFDGCTGKLTDVPYSEKAPEFAKLKMWTCIEMHGFVYLWHHAENKEPYWYPDTVPEVESGEWKYRGRTEYLVACHIQEIPENAADAAHLNVVHSTPIITGARPEMSKLNWKAFKQVFDAGWAPNTEPREHEALLKVHTHFSVFDKITLFHVDIVVHQLGPGVVLMMLDTALGKGLLIQNVTPLEPMLQRMTHRFYSAPSLIQPLGNLILLTEGIQITRDIRIWNRKTFLRRPILTKEEKRIKTFRRWYSQFYSENSPSLGANPAVKTNEKLDF